MEKPDIKRPMTGEEVLAMVLNLAHCQGSYTRMYLDIERTREEDPEAYRKLLAEWESEKFTDPTQVIAYFENGKHNARKFWKVPVVYEMYGRIDVEAESGEEAYRKVRDNPDDYGLPEDASYVDDSFHVADDDEENAIAIVKMMTEVGE